MKKIFIILALFACLLSQAQIRPVIISEVFYDTPLEENVQCDVLRHHSGEFIEIYNPTLEDIDISGWKIKDNRNGFTFPNNTIISSYANIVIAFKSSDTDFILSDLFPEMPENTQIIYQNRFVLQNDGEKISLFDGKHTVDEMSYRFKRVVEAGREYSTFWDIRAHNGTKSNNLLSLQRNEIHVTSSLILPLKEDYIAATPTPGEVNEVLQTAIIENELYPIGEINNNLPVGSLAGEAAVSPTGAATYNIPIEVPIGTNGFQPQISIAYNSQGGYGALGIGWDIGGLSSISRGMQTFYFDKTDNGTIDAQTIKFDKTDCLYIDGQRLILLSGNHFQSGTIYSGEQENYTRVQIKTNPETQKIYFELTTKEGNIVEYGKTDDALLKDSDKVMAWIMNKQKDVNGNEIEYTYQDNGQYLRFVRYGENKIKFIYDNNTKSPKKRYINGFCLKQENLLDEIDIYTNNKLVKGYSLVYNTSETNAKLDAIKPFFAIPNLSFTSHIFKTNRQYINSTKIGWGEESEIEKRELSHTTTLSQKDNTCLYTGDIDGDGYSDIIELYGGKWTTNDVVAGTIKVYLKNSTLPIREFQPNSEKYFIPKLMVADLDNNGKSEIVLCNYDKHNGDFHLNVYAINSSNTTLSLLNTNIIPNFDVLYDYKLQYNAVLTNLNDDEYLDIVIVGYKSETTDLSQFANNQGIFIGKLYGATNCTFNNYENNWINTEKNIKIEGQQLLGDFNADGKLDFLHLLTPKYSSNVAYNDHITIQESKNWNTDNDKGHFFFKEGAIFIRYKPFFQSLYSIDVNDDGRTDIVYQGNKHTEPDYEWHIAFSNGLDAKPTVQEELNIARASSHSEYKKDDDQYPIFLDYNGDGLMDIVIADETFLKSCKGFCDTQWHFYKNINGTFKADKTFYTKEQLSKMQPVVIDINNDGVQDLVYVENGIFKIFTMPSANKRNVVHSITNGFGQTERFKYKYFSEYNNEEQSSSSDMRNLKTPLMVVDKYVSTTGTITAYDYENPKIHIKGKGLLGFEKITTTNSRTKQKIVSEYEIKTECQLFVNAFYAVNLKNRTIYVDNVKISETSNWNNIIFCGNANIQRGQNGEKRFIPIIKKQFFFDKIKNITTTTEYDYNGDGILYKETQKKGDITIIKEYINFQQRGVAGGIAYLPQIVKVTKSREGQEEEYIFKTSYTYDNKGNIETSIENKNTYAENTTAYEYYPTGNLKKITVTNSDYTEPHVTKYAYDDAFCFVTETENVLGQKSYKWYNNFGQLENETGIDGITTSYLYDVLGQLDTKILPNNEKIFYNTSWGEGKTLFKTTETSSKYGKLKETHYNSHGLEIYSETLGFGGAMLKSNTEYDFLKLKVNKKTKPHYDGETEIYTEFLYDDYLQRVTEEKLFDGENTLTTSYSYNDAEGKVTVTPPKTEQATTTTTNILGEVTERTDAGGTITYTYNALSSPINVKVESGGLTSETLIVYDEAGRQKELHDPNAGTVSYEYYADGQLKKQTNANNDITEMEYDIAGRTENKTVTDKDKNGIIIGISETSYQYIETGNGIGQLESVELKENSIITHSKSYTYNNKQLVESVTDHIFENFVEKTFAFFYNYDYLWRLKTTTSPSGFVTTNKYNDFGNLIEVKNGENVIWHGTAQNSNGQFTHYDFGNGISTVNTYNRRGELLDIQAKKGNDFIQNNHYEYEAQTGNLLVRNDLKNNRNEHFEYDNLDRLTKTYLNDVSQQEISYYNNGNIDEKTDVGKYFYDDEDKPHSMRGIEDIPVENNISDEKQFIEYTSFNKVSRVAQGVDLENITVEYKIYYGLDQQRIKTEFFENGNLKKTRYYFGIYELDIDENNNETEVDYIFTPTGLTAIVKNEEIFYVFTDRQGSIEKITDTDGEIVSSYAYSAWGVRTLLDGEDITDRGYTGHEHLLALGLINMNGRIYDPVLARFLSPDPFVQAPDFTQSFNRYAYCLNNPFKFSDPSGEFVVTAIVIGAVVGIIVGAYIGHQIGEANGATGWEMVGYTVCGALIGGVGGAAAGWAGGAVAGAIGIGGFAGGAIAGGTAGAVGGFINGAGMAWLGGTSFGDGLLNGLIGAGIGAGTGAVLGGVVQGISALEAGGNFWTGKMPTPPTQTAATTNNSATQPTTSTEPSRYNANYKNPSEIKLPEKVYHYTDQDPSNWTTIGKIDANPKNPTYFTTDGSLTKVSAVSDLSLNKVPNFKVEISGATLDPNKIMIIRTVNGNVFNQGGGGWEIIYNGWVQNGAQIIITPLP
jgi:RHS repeat-associated protein